MFAELTGHNKFSDVLERLNPVLSPQKLAQAFPGLGYEHFIVRKNLFSVPKGEFQISIRSGIENQIGVWDRRDIEPGMHKTIILLSTVSTGGKDAFREMLQQLHPGLAVKVITATSRPSRKDEIEGRDYYFYTREEFEEAIERSEFLEYVDLNQGTGEPPRYMGLPKKSLVKALSGRAPIVVCHVEMTHGWPAVNKWLQESYPPDKAPIALKAVIIPQVMPEMTFKSLKKRIVRLRQDADPRIANAIKELWLAPQLADILITNLIPVDGNKTGLIRAVTELMLVLKSVNLYGLQRSPEFQ